jgi:hypothetical protein
MKDNSQKQTDFDAELKDFQERLKEEWQNTVKESIRVHIGEKAFEKINDIELVFIDSPDKVLPNIDGKEKSFRRRAKNIGQGKHQTCK